MKVKVFFAQPCLTLCDHVDCSSPGPSVHGILQARILEWLAIPFSRGSSQPRDRTWVSCIAGRFFIIWATNQEMILKTHCRIQAFTRDGSRWSALQASLFFLIGIDDTVILIMFITFQSAFMCIMALFSSSFTRWGWEVLQGPPLLYHKVEVSLYWTQRGARKHPRSPSSKFLSRTP